MVVYSPRMSPSGNATSSTTCVFSPQRSPAYASDYSAGYDGGVNIRNAICIGPWTNSTTPIRPIEPVCSTGNFTWLAYRSLGICAQMADVSNLITNPENKTNSTSRMKALPNGVFLNISPQWPSAINVINSQQAATCLPATSAFEDVPETARLTGVFVIIDYSKGEGTKTSALELSLNFCIREYNTVVTNGHASTNETVVVAAPQSNATLIPDDGAHIHRTSRPIFQLFSLRQYVKRQGT
jgi:hypothetical protein